MLNPDLLVPVATTVFTLLTYYSMPMIKYWQRKQREEEERARREDE